MPLHKLNYSKIETLLSDKNVEKMEFYKIIEMSVSGFLKMMELQRMKVDTLEKIATFFNKPVGWFFDECTELNHKKDSSLKDDNFKVKYYEILEKYTLALEEIKELNASRMKSPTATPKPIHK